MKKIKTENDLLGFMIKYADKRNDFQIKVLIDHFGTESLLDFSYMIKELEEKRYVSITCLDIIHIHPLGRNRYISPAKRLFLFFIKFTTTLFTAIIGAALSNIDKIWGFLKSL